MLNLGKYLNETTSKMSRIKARRGWTSLETGFTDGPRPEQTCVGGIWDKKYEIKQPKFESHIVEEVARVRKRKLAAASIPPKMNKM